jgi:hypothetical protein
MWWKARREIFEDEFVARNGTRHLPKSKLLKIIEKLRPGNN